GLDPEDYESSRLHELLRATHRGLLGPAPDPGRLAELDLLATRAWLKCAAHLFTGRVDPGALPADWHLKPRRTDLVARLEGALKRDRVGAALRELAPASPGYAALREALARYRRA